MGWFRKRRADPEPVLMDVAERMIGRGSSLDCETASVRDRETVQRWLREMNPGRDEQVFVHRPWGTLTAVADGRRAVDVLRTDGEHSWFAVPPGGADDQELTPEQVEHVMLDALSAAAPPTWPDWRSLV